MKSAPDLHLTAQSRRISVRSPGDRDEVCASVSAGSIAPSIVMASVCEWVSGRQENTGPWGIPLRVSISYKGASGLRNLGAPGREEAAVVEPSSVSPVSTFVVRFWRECSSAGSRWRGRIEHVQSGQSATFLGLDGMLDFVRRFGVMAEEPLQSAEEGQRKGEE